MMRSLGSQLGLNQSELKLNWIDRLATKLSKSSSDDYTNTLYQGGVDDELSSSSYNYANDYQPTSSEEANEPTDRANGQLLSEVELDDTNRRNHIADSSNDQIVLISFSSSHLYELQRLFLENLKQLSGNFFYFTLI